MQKNDREMAKYETIRTAMDCLLQAELCVLRGAQFIPVGLWFPNTTAAPEISPGIYHNVDSQGLQPTH